MFMEDLERRFSSHLVEQLTQEPTKLYITIYGYNDFADEFVKKYTNERCVIEIFRKEKDTVTYLIESQDLKIIKKQIINDPVFSIQDNGLYYKADFRKREFKLGDLTLLSSNIDPWRLRRLASTAKEKLMEENK